MLRIKTKKPEQALAIASNLRKDHPEVYTSTLGERNGWVIETGADENTVRMCAYRTGARNGDWWITTQRVLVMYLDYTGLPRAWGSAPIGHQAEAEAEANRQLTLYCARQAGIEPDLADRSKYTRKIEFYDGEA